MPRFQLADHLQKAQPPQARDIEAITAEILDAKRAGGEAILTIGRGLMEAKALLPHGEWLPWLEERVEFSEKAAQNFMRIARNYANPQALADLGATKALMLLAVPDDARDEFISTPHLVDGEEKTVIDMTSRELDRAIKERDEALKAAAQAQAEQAAAEQARKKMAEDMALANGHMEGLRDEAAAQAERLKAARENAERLEAELRELRARPVDVAVQVDETAVETARREAEEAMQAQLNKARKAREKALDQVSTANDALKSTKQELEQAQAELEALRAKAAQAEKKASLAANEDLVLFRTLFDQVQEQINKMGGVLMKVRGKDPEKAAGLSKALLALAEKVREAAAP